MCVHVCVNVCVNAALSGCGLVRAQQSLVSSLAQTWHMNDHQHFEIKNGFGEEGRDRIYPNKRVNELII